jgi:SAM-dependent methyltransferase
MKQRLLKFLACPSCRAAVHLREATADDDGEIMAGTLSCEGCAQIFPIMNGVPRFASMADVGEEKAEIATKFGYEWKHFTQEDTRYGDQFLGWLNPVTPEFFTDKIVLDAGCGKGRHSVLAAEWGAREVIGIDLSEAVDIAFAATRNRDNVHVVQADVCHLPFAQTFDYAFSLGVLDHIPDPLEGFRSIASRLKPGGRLSVWVYGAENNEWITRFVDPVRTRFTSRVSPRTLLHLSKIPTAILYLTTKLIYGPLKRIGGMRTVNKLFYGEYLSNLADFGWREQHTIVFDHLVAPTAHYVSRPQFESWWQCIGVTAPVIGFHNQNSWRGFGQISESSAADD